MQRITTRKELIERIKDILAVEIQARKNYEADMKSFTNLEIFQTIKKIKIDEDKHIALLKNLLDILENP